MKVMYTVTELLQLLLTGMQYNIESGQRRATNTSSIK